MNMFRKKISKKLRIIFLIFIITTSIQYVNKLVDSTIHKHIKYFKRYLELNDNILRSTITTPYISGTNFYFQADYVYTEHFKNIEPVEKLDNGNVIFVKMTLVDEFFTKIFPLITKRIILITYNYDEPSLKKHKRYLLNTNLLAWFSSNPGFFHPKHIPLPLGFQSSYLEGFKTLALRLETKLKDTLHISLRDSEKVNFLRDFEASSYLKPWKKRKYLLYVNFLVHNSDPGDRVKLKSYFKAFKNVLYVDSKVDYFTYMNHLNDSKYVICPSGYGLDSFRYYESILMGSIPVVKNSTLFVKLKYNLIQL